MTLAKPKGIQLKRTRGYRKPPNAIVVKRLGPKAKWKWGNPFVVGVGFIGPDGIMQIDIPVPDKAAAVCLFEDWLLHSDDARAQWIRDHLHELRGHDLACSCPLGSPCHRDVLLRLANADRIDFS